MHGVVYVVYYLVEVFEVASASYILYTQHDDDA